MIHLNDARGYQRSFLAKRHDGNSWAKVSVAGECFWIRDVQGTEEASVLMGVIDNNPLYSGTHGLSLGDCVTFIPEES